MSLRVHARLPSATPRPLYADVGLQQAAMEIMRRQSSMCTVMCILAAAALFSTAHAHGGDLHKYSYRQDVRQYVPAAQILNDIHLPVGTCSNFTVLNLTALTPSAWTLPFFPGMLNVSVQGSIDITAYLSGNCTDGFSSALLPLLNLTVSIPQGNNRWVSRPLPYGYTASAYGFQGTCAAPGNLYRNDVTLQDNRFNLAWWGFDNVVGQGASLSDIRPGILWGAAPQAWFFRNATDPARMRSIVLLVESGPAFCCNVDYAGDPVPDTVLALGSNCTYTDDD